MGRNGNDPSCAAAFPDKSGNPGEPRVFPLRLYPSEPSILSLLLTYLPNLKMKI